MVTIEQSRSKKGGQRKYLRITGDNNEKLVRSETMFQSLSVINNARATYEQLKRIFEGGEEIMDNTKPKKKKL